MQSFQLPGLGERPAVPASIPLISHMGAPSCKDISRSCTNIVEVCQVAAASHRQDNRECITFFRFISVRVASLQHVSSQRLQPALDHASGCRSRSSSPTYSFSDPGHSKPGIGLMMHSPDAPWPDVREESDNAREAGTQPNEMASMPGFRFQPTEEELVGFYLRSMVAGNRLEVELINVLDLYRYDPWELPAMAFMQGEREWLFFCPRDKKYPNGDRPNRVTTSGYWKATGTDRPVRRTQDSCCIGLKKTLVFYTGKAPKGRKTEWIMNEYRLPQNDQYCQAIHHLQKFKGQKDVALCRIYKKPAHVPTTTNFLAECIHEEFAPTVVLDHSKSSTNDPQALQSNFLLRRILRDACIANLDEKQISASAEPSSLVTFDHKRSILEEMEKILDSEVTKMEEQNSSVHARPEATKIPDHYSSIVSPADTDLTCSSTRSVKLETSELSSIFYPVPYDESHTQTMASISAQILQAEARRTLFLNSIPQPSAEAGNSMDHRRSTDHVQLPPNGLSSSRTHGIQSALDQNMPSSWFRQDQQQQLCHALHVTDGPAGADHLLQPNCSSPITLSSIDRFLKTSAWTPLPPAHDSAGSAAISTQIKDVDRQSIFPAAGFAWNMSST